jgi:hypothetical protein
VSPQPTEEAGSSDLRGALEETDLRLRRLLRSFGERQDPDSQEMQLEVRRTRRRLRANRELLGHEGGDED